MAMPEPKSHLLGHSWPQPAEHLHAELCHRGTPWASRCVPLEVATGAGDVRSRHQGSGLQVMAKCAQDPQRLFFGWDAGFMSAVAGLHQQNVREDNLGSPGGLVAEMIAANPFGLGNG